MIRHVCQREQIITHHVFSPCVKILFEVCWSVEVLLYQKSILLTFVSTKQYQDLPLEKTVILIMTAKER